MDKDDVVCVYTYIYIHTRTYTGILLIHKKNEIWLAIWNNTEGPRDYHA